MCDMSIHPLMPIGVFSTASLVSIKSLRRYYEQGLLAPAAIDPSTGYRPTNPCVSCESSVSTKQWASYYPTMKYAPKLPGDRCPFSFAAQLSSLATSCALASRITDLPLLTRFIPAAHRLRNDAGNSSVIAGNDEFALSIQSDAGWCSELEWEL